MSDEDTKMDPRQPLRNMVEGYAGKKPSDDATKEQLRAILRGTPDYQKAFAQRKDEVMALEDMAVRVQHGVDVAAWLVDGNAKQFAKGQKRTDAPRAQGAKFMLPSGYDKFVNFGGPMPNAPPILTEFIFPGATVTTDYTANPPRLSYDTRGMKPVQKAHGATPPATSLQNPLEFAWKYNEKKGTIRGEARVDLALLQITSDEGDITFFQANEYNDSPTLHYIAIDGEGTMAEVHDDPNNAATQLGIPVDSPARLWKTKLAGRKIACSGVIEALTYAGDKTFGEGALANLAAQNKDYLVQGDPEKDALKFNLSFKHLYGPDNLRPCIVHEETKKAIYQLESYTGKSADGSPRQVWKAMVPLNGEVDRNGKPRAWVLKCFPETREKRAGGTFTRREDAWLTYLGAAKASESSRQMFLD